MASLNAVLICQAVDQDDPISATLVRWIRALAANDRVARVHVLTLRVGRYELPDNVSVVDLGVGRVTRLVRFYASIGTAIRNRSADFFFVVQGGPYPALLLPIKLLTRRGVYQWKTHSHVSRSMAMHARWCDDLVFTATSSSFPLALPNVRVVGHGIDVGQFAPVPCSGPAVSDLIVVGRVTPVKRIAGIVRAMVSARNSLGIEWSLDIYGPELDADRDYRIFLDHLIARFDLTDAVHFRGAVRHDEMADLLRRYRAAVSFSDGGLDKAIAEAMACGVPVVSTNASYAELLPPDLRDLLMLDYEDEEKQARGIARVLQLDDSERAGIGNRLREIVERHHGLTEFWEKILLEIANTDDAHPPWTAGRSARR
jgi:glycosyltransferase involved in cell wall biosynthesis